MATVQISELTAISTATTDDNFIINDGNAATRRITFADLVTSVANQAITFTQDITFSGATSGISIDELSDVDTTTAAPTSGQVLAWNGTNWAPAADATSLAFELGTGEILNRAATRGHVIKLRDLLDVNKIILNTGTGDIDSQGNLSGAEIQVNGAQITLSDLADGGNLTTLTGVAADAAHLGTFTGTTIADSSTIKTALQALETSLEAIDIDTDDLAALTGISENTTNLGTFTGSTISDNVAVKTALQEIETAVELRATAASVSNVDNTSDADKPVSTATQTALDLKANAADVSNVDNTSDADKPVSTATQTALDAKAGLTGGNTYTGTQVVRDKIEIKPADSTYFLRLNRNTATQLDIITQNIPSGGNLNIKNSNGTDAKVVVYSDLFWVRNLGGSNGNGKAQFDGDVTFTPSASVTPASNGQLMVEATNDTTLTFKLKGSDGVVRSGTITLS